MNSQRSPSPGTLERHKITISMDDRSRYGNRSGCYALKDSSGCLAIAVHLNIPHHRAVATHWRTDSAIRSDAASNQIYSVGVPILSLMIFDSDHFHTKAAHVRKIAIKWRSS
jgi:hypothetical protein